MASCPSKTELRQGHFHVLAVTNREGFLSVPTDLEFLAISTVTMPFELFFGNTGVKRELDTKHESSLARIVERLDWITDSIPMMPNFMVAGFRVPKAGRVSGRSASI